MRNELSLLWYILERQGEQRIKKFLDGKWSLPEIGELARKYPLDFFEFLEKLREKYEDLEEREELFPEQINEVATAKMIDYLQVAQEESQKTSLTGGSLPKLAELTAKKSVQEKLIEQGESQNASSIGDSFSKIIVKLRNYFPCYDFSQEDKYRYTACSSSKKRFPQYISVLRLPTIKPLGMLIIRGKTLWLSAIHEQPLNIVEIRFIHHKDKLHDNQLQTTCEKEESQIEYLKIVMDALGIQDDKKYNFSIQKIQIKEYPIAEFAEYEISLNKEIVNRIEISSIGKEEEESLIIKSLRAGAEKNLTAFGSKFPNKKPEDEDYQLTLLYYLLYYWDDFPNDYKEKYFKNKQWLPTYFRERV